MATRVIQPYRQGETVVRPVDIAVSHLYWYVGSLLTPKQATVRIIVAQVVSQPLGNAPQYCLRTTLAEMFLQGTTWATHAIQRWPQEELAVQLPDIAVSCRYR